MPRLCSLKNLFSPSELGVSPVGSMPGPSTITGDDPMVAGTDSTGLGGNRNSVSVCKNDNFCSFSVFMLFDEVEAFLGEVKPCASAATDSFKFKNGTFLDEAKVH